MAANVAYPTKSGLLANGVVRMAAAAKKLKGTGLGRPGGHPGPDCSVRYLAHEVAAWLRRRNDEADEEVFGITGELADIAEGRWPRPGR